MKAKTGIKQRSMPTPKQVLFIGDTHCGHENGLTGPEWWEYIEAGPKRECAKRGWAWWLDFNKRRGPFDLVVSLGDGIDGRGEKNDGREIIVPPEKQKDMYLSVLESTRCSQFALCEGTHYHSSDGCKWELETVKLLLARGAAVDFGERLSLTINGYHVDAKHHVGGSQAPSGGDAALRAEIVSAAEWAAEYGYKVPNCSVRGHVHRERVVGGGKRWCRTLPALQMWTSFGALRCRGLFHWGATVLNVSPSGVGIWSSELRELRSESVTPHIVL